MVKTVAIICTNRRAGGSAPAEKLHFAENIPAVKYTNIPHTPCRAGGSAPAVFGNPFRCKLLGEIRDNITKFICGGSKPPPYRSKDTKASK